MENVSFSTVENCATNALETSSTVALSPKRMNFQIYFSQFLEFLEKLIVNTREEEVISTSNETNFIRLGQYLSKIWAPKLYVMKNCAPFLSPT